jgi:hypothetical protein
MRSEQKLYKNPHFATKQSTDKHAAPAAAEDNSSSTGFFMKEIQHTHVIERDSLPKENKQNRCCKCKMLDGRV